MENATVSGQALLVEKVMDKGICVGCGACVGICPYFSYFDGKVVVTDQCNADTWRCLQLCPRADYPETSPEAEKGAHAERLEIGPYKKAFLARAQDEEIRERSQYGGVVSALLIGALEKGIIKSAVLTDSGNRFSPGGTIAADRPEILDCAGSRYSASGGLSALNRAIKSGQDGLCVVGLPCQMEALKRMKRMKPDGREMNDRISLKIGVFCTWAIDYRDLKSFLVRKGVSETIKKYDIPPPPAEIFRILTENGWRDFPLSEIRPFIQKGCALCTDMTAEMADISVGNAEAQEGWNTVVIRTNKGDELIKRALENGWIETGDLSEKSFNHLKEASENKRKRGENQRKIY